MKPFIRFPRPVAISLLISAGASLPLSASAQWFAGYDGPDSSSGYARAVAEHDGSVFVAGYGFGAARDFLTARFDAGPAPTWTRTESGPGSSSDEIVAAAVDSNGNVIVTGHMINANGDQDIITVKYDPDGFPTWVAASGGATRSVYPPMAGNGWPNRPDAAGIAEHDRPAGLVVDEAGDIYVVGRSSDVFGTTVGGESCTSYSTTDEPLPVSPAPGIHLSTAHLLPGDGHILAAENTSVDLVTFKISGADGSILWHRRECGTDSGLPDVANDVVVNGDAVYVIGQASVTRSAWLGGQERKETAADIAIYAYDRETGQPLWAVFDGRCNVDGTQLHCGSEEGIAGAFDSSGELAVVAQLNNFGGGTQDIWAARIDSSTGAIAAPWPYVFDSGAIDTPRDLASGFTGGFYVVGDSGSDYVTLGFEPAALSWWDAFDGGGSLSDHGTGVTVTRAPSGADLVWVTGAASAPSASRTLTTITYESSVAAAAPDPSPFQVLRDIRVALVMDTNLPSILAGDDGCVYVTAGAAQSLALPPPGGANGNDDFALIRYGSDEGLDGCPLP